VRKWLTGRRACLVAAGMALVLAAGIGLRLYWLFAPKHIETLDLIEERTGWTFPPQTRIVSAGQDNLGMDFAIWAVLEVPRDAVRSVFLAKTGGQLQQEEGESGFPKVCMHMGGDYWSFAPKWLPPLPGSFEHYFAASRFGPTYNMREAIAEMGDGDSEMVTVYVFYTTY